MMTIPKNEIPLWHQAYLHSEADFQMDLDKQRVPEVEYYIHAVFGYVDLLLSNIKSKATKNTECITKLFPILVQMSDLLRGCIHSQENLILSNAVIAARISLEARANLLFIYNHKTPHLMIDRMSAFGTYEEICYRKESAINHSPTADFEKEFTDLHPYWGDENGRVKPNQKWHGTKKLNLYGICESVGLKEFYIEVYMHGSRWAHASPGVAVLYTRDDKKILHSIAKPGIISMNVISSGQMILALIQDFCVFFGISMKVPDIKYLSGLANSAQKAIGMDHVR